MPLPLKLSGPLARQQQKARPNARTASPSARRCSSAGANTLVRRVPATGASPGPSEERPARAHQGVEPYLTLSSNPATVQSYLPAPRCTVIKKAVAVS